MGTLKTKKLHSSQIEVMRWLIIGALAFLWIATLNYHSEDSAYSHLTSVREVKNVCGWVGALIADYNLSYLGFSAALAPIVLAIALIAGLVQLSSWGLGMRLMASAGLSLSFSALEACFAARWQLNSSYLPMGLGGILGKLLWQGLIGPLGPIGGFSALAGCVVLELNILLNNLNWHLDVAFSAIFKFLVGAAGGAALVLKSLLIKAFAALLSFSTKLKLFSRNKTESEAISTSLEAANDMSLEELTAAIKAPEVKELDLASLAASVEGDVAVADSAKMAETIENIIESSEASEKAAEVAETASAFETTEAINNLDSNSKINLDVIGASSADSAKEGDASADEGAETINSVEAASTKVAAPAADQESASEEGASFKLPDLELLSSEPQETSSSLRKKYNAQELSELSREVEQKLQDFGIKAKVVNALPGPVITRFELSLAAGTKASRITSLAKDLARSLSVFSVRVVEVIPGKSVIGLELPNPHREIVRLRDLLTSKTFIESHARLAIALGKSIAGEPVVVDLTKMPHLLVAGTTGSGKSVCINAMLLSLLYKYTPSELKLILIDPKMLELSVYDGIPHLLTKVIVDMKEVTSVFSWCVAEMERRYRLMAALGVRNLVGFNQQILEATKANRQLQNPLWEGEGSLEPQFLAPLPYLVVMADEYADMMMVVGKKIEELIVRLAQKARAAGIHLILATQRPSVDVVTGLIKANIPTRIAFQVSSRVDSRTILDQSGAEQLLGAGDMLYLPIGSGVPTRVHGAFVGDDEVHRVVSELKKNHKANTQPLLWPSGHQEVSGLSTGVEGDAEAEDELYDQAVAWVLENRRVSISALQRRFRIGYNRAARLVDSMEVAKVVGPMNSSGVRSVLLGAKD